MKVTIEDIVEFYDENPEYIGKLLADTRYGFKKIEFADVTSYDSEIYEVTLDNGLSIKTSPDHLLFINDSWKKTKDIVVGDICSHKTGKSKIKNVALLDYKDDLFDLQIEEVHEFFANDIVSHNSTLLDALTFVLFGKPFRNINKPGLLNSINEKDCVVEIYFKIGKKSYKIVRGIKPAIFEIYCDSQLINQEASSRDYQEYLEKFILKMNYRSFKQIVVLGSSTFIPFMQLTAADRRAIIEDLLDIQIFSYMNVVLKQKLLSLKDQMTEIAHDRELVRVKIESTKKLISEIDNSNIAQIEKIDKDIIENMNQIEKLTNECEANQNDIDALNSDISDESKTNKKFSKLTNLSEKIQNNILKVKNEIQFYEENDNCPTCHQSIDDNHKNDQIQIYTKKILEYENGLSSLNGEIENLKERLSKISNIANTIREKSNEMQQKTATILAIRSYVARLNRDRNNIEKTRNTNTTYNDDLEKLKNKLDELEENEKNIINDKHNHEQVAILLKDTGIKTKIIKQYLPVMNKLINKYLSSMEFYVNFNINENFEEVIKSRYRDEFSYENFSEGEKQKIDLALLFTWRAIAKMKNSVNTNLLVLDEIFDSSLDANGTEELLKILNSISADTNVFVISHKSDIFIEKFRNTIKFEKINNFSRIVH